MGNGPKKTLHWILKKAEDFDVIDDLARWALGRVFGGKMADEREKGDKKEGGKGPSAGARILEKILEGADTALERGAESAKRWADARHQQIDKNRALKKLDDSKWGPIIGIAMIALGVVVGLVMRACA